MPEAGRAALLCSYALCPAPELLAAAPNGDGASDVATPREERTPPATPSDAKRDRGSDPLLRSASAIGLPTDEEVIGDFDKPERVAADRLWRRLRARAASGAVDVRSPRVRRLVERVMARGSRRVSERRSRA